MSVNWQNTRILLLLLFYIPTDWFSKRFLRHINGHSYEFSPRSRLFFFNKPSLIVYNIVGNIYQSSIQYLNVILELIVSDSKFVKIQE